MTVKKRRKLLFIAAFINMCVLLVLKTFFSTRDQVLTDEYISQFTIPKQIKEVASEEETETTETSFKRSFKLTNTDQTSHLNILESNLTITFLQTAEDKIIKRNVFIELNCINKSSTNIFFVESRCSVDQIAIHFKGNRGFVLNARQCCAIESTAQMNLDHNVYIFHSCPLDDDFFQHSPKFVQHLFKYTNIYVVRLNSSELLLGSPLEKLYRKKLETSEYPVEHISDSLRLTLLWRFGGTYSDLDVVTVRSFKNLTTNWAGMQDPVTIGAGVLNFEPEGVGHNIIQRALEYANKHFDPHDWSSNGPSVITSTILEECKAKKVAEAQKHCNGRFNVLYMAALYPVHYGFSDQLFNNSLGEKIVSFVKNVSFSVHIWNKITRNLAVTVGSNQAYALLADEYCPQVYRNCGPTF